ncbi:MAG: PH domain-containing protein [Acidobacteria bacterium]|nr:PH domain-containing protein [Acidobacteriota bacterium]
MAFPAKLLNEGEEVVVDLRPHWWFFAGPASLLVLALLALIAVRAVGDWAVLAAAGVVLAALLWFAGRYTRWATTNFVVTTDRIVYRSGVVAKHGIEIPLDRVNTIFSHQSIFERLVGAGDLVIESGGEHGDEAFSNIPRPARVQNQVYAQIEADQQRRFGGVPGPDPIAQLDRLDDLRRRGVITEAEFQAKKAKLLDQL